MVVVGAQAVEYLGGEGADGLPKKWGGRGGKENIERGGFHCHPPPQNILHPSTKNAPTLRRMRTDSREGHDETSDMWRLLCTKEDWMLGVGKMRDGSYLDSIKSDSKVDSKEDRERGGIIK